VSSDVADKILNVESCDKKNGDFYGTFVEANVKYIREKNIFLISF